MNWEAIGAIAELFGAIGVIGSLIYLAKQINANSENIAQNTRALVSDRDVDSNQNAKDIAGDIYRDPALAALIVKGHRSAEPLEEVDRIRYNTLLSTMFEAHQTFYIQHVKGTVSDELWEFYSGMFDRHMQAPGVKRWWLRHGSLFNPDFCTYIQAKIKDDA